MLKTYTNSDTMEECNCVQLSFIGFVTYQKKKKFYWICRISAWSVCNPSCCLHIFRLKGQNQPSCQIHGFQIGFLYYDFEDDNNSYFC